MKIINFEQNWENFTSYEFLIIENEDIIGTCTLFLKDDSFIIESFYIAKKFRKKGIGLMLLNDVINFANKKNPDIKIFLQSYINSNAYNWYLKNGFVFYSDKAYSNCHWLIKK